MNSDNSNNSSLVLPKDLNLNVRRPFLELTLKVNGIKVGIAIGLNGLLVVVQRFGQRWLVAVGKWGTHR